MPQWTLFLAVTLVLTVLLLVLARFSQNAIDEFAPDTDEDTAEVETTEQHGFDSDPVEGPHQQPPSEELRRQPPSEELHRQPPSEKSQQQPPPEDSYQEPRPGELHHQPPPEAPHQDRKEIQPPREGDEIPPPRENEEIVLTSGMLMVNVALTQGLVVLVLASAAWYFDIPATAFGITGDALSTGAPAVAVGIAFGVVLWIGNELSTTLADAVGASYDERVRELLAPESTRGWVALFGGVLPLIAVAEELLFRAALIGVPAAGFDVNVWILAALSSVAFALGHGAQGRVGIVVTGALGFVLAAGYVVTGSLLVVVVAHYVINALEFFVHEFLGVEDLTPQRVQAPSR